MDDPAQVIGVYMTFPDDDTADRIARALVDERLVAYPSPGGLPAYLDWLAAETGGCDQ